MTVSELKEYLNKLPDEFDSYLIVNGEYGELNEEIFYRVDNSVNHIIVDEDNNEICFFHQTQEEINDIKK